MGAPQPADQPFYQPYTYETPVFYGAGASSAAPVHSVQMGYPYHPDMGGRFDHRPGSQQQWQGHQAAVPPLARPTRVADLRQQWEDNTSQAQHSEQRPHADVFRGQPYYVGQVGQARSSQQPDDRMPEFEASRFDIYDGYLRSVEAQARADLTAQLGPPLPRAPEAEQSNRFASLAGDRPRSTPLG